MEQCGGFLPLLLDLLNQGRQQRRLPCVARWPHQERRGEPSGQVAIKHGPHASWKFEAGHEVLVEATAANHEDRLVADLHPPDGGKTQRRSVGKFLLPEKGGWRQRSRRQRTFLITKFRRPLRRRENGAAAVHEFQKVQLLVVGERLGLVHVGTVVRGTTAHGQRNAGGGVAAGDGFHAVCHFVTPPAELAAKLRDQTRRLSFVGPLEGAPGHAGYDPGDRAHAKKNRQREYQQKFAAKAQGFPDSSQTSCKRQLPSGSSRQPITLVASATAVRKCSRGTTRCDCSRVLSAAYAVDASALCCSGSPSNFGCGNPRLRASSISATQVSSEGSGRRTRRMSAAAAAVGCSVSPASRAFRAMRSAMTRASGSDAS